VQILFVEGTANGPQFRLGSRTFTDRSSLLPILASLPKDRGIVVKTTNSATVGGAAAAVQVCKDAGFDKVSYVPGSSDTRPSPAAPPAGGAAPSAPTPAPPPAPKPSP
jgi:hypothetical protein